MKCFFEFFMITGVSKLLLICGIEEPFSCFLSVLNHWDYQVEDLMMLEFGKMNMFLLDSPSEMF